MSDDADTDSDAPVRSVKFKTAAGTMMYREDGTDPDEFREAAIKLYAQIVQTQRNQMEFQGFDPDGEETPDAHDHNGGVF